MIRRMSLLCIVTVEREEQEQLSVPCCSFLATLIMWMTRWGSMESRDSLMAKELVSHANYATSTTLRPSIDTRSSLQPSRDWRESSFLECQITPMVAVFPSLRSTIAEDLTSKRSLPTQQTDSTIKRKEAPSFCWRRGRKWAGPSTATPRSFSSMQGSQTRWFVDWCLTPRSFSEAITLRRVKWS